MTRGLEEWDARVARVESGLRAEITNAPPPVAAQMRATLGTVYLERGRIEDALAQFGAAVGSRSVPCAGSRAARAGLRPREPCC